MSKVPVPVRQHPWVSIGAVVGSCAVLYGTAYDSDFILRSGIILLLVVLGYMTLTTTGGPPPTE